MVHKNWVELNFQYNGLVKQRGGGTPIQSWLRKHFPQYESTFSLMTYFYKLTNRRSHLIPTFINLRIDVLNCYLLNELTNRRTQLLPTVLNSRNDLLNF